MFAKKVRRHDHVMQEPSKGEEMRSDGVEDKLKTKVYALVLSFTSHKLIREVISTKLI